MMTEYMQPLIELSKKPRSFVSPEATDAIFGNVLTVYGFNAQFLPMIEARMKRWSVTTTKLSDLYFHIEHGKKAYQEYIANFDRSANVLSTCLRNYEFYRWHEEVCHKASVGSLRLNSFLIMPVQRIPRYELLLRELIAHTPEDHPDLPALRSAYENLREVSKSINEFKRAAELKVRLMEIQADLRTTCPDLAQPYRSYVDEVEVGVVLKKALRRAVLVLLSDQVLIVRCNSEKHITKMVSQVYLFNASVNITQDYDDVAVEPAPAVSSIFMDFMDSPATAEDFNFGLRIQGRAEACVVYFATAKARDEWIPKISQQKSDLHNNLSTLNLTKDEENIITESAITMAASSNANGTLSASTVVGGIGGGSGSVIVGGGSGGGGGSGSVIVGGGAGGSGSVIVVGSGGGNGNSGGVSGGISVVKDVLDLYESVVKIQDEIMQNPIDLRTLFPEYCRGMNPSIKSRLKQRIDQLNIKLNMMYQLDQRARELISAGRGAIPVQKVNQFIKEGITPIDAMKTFIVTNYKAYPAGIKDDPRITIRLILKWYLDLTDSWNKFITSDLSN